MSPGHTLKLLPWGLWGAVILKDIIPEPFNYAEQNSYLKIIWLVVFGEVVGVGGG